MDDDKQFEILEFLETQSAPVTADKFPVQIRAKYVKGIGAQSLVFALMKMGSNGFVKNKGLHKYIITETGKELLEHYRSKDKLTTEQNKKEVSVFISNNYAGRDVINQSSGQDSSVSADNSMNISSANNQNPGWRKISSFIVNNIVVIIVSLVVAYLVYRFGWNR